MVLDASALLAWYEDEPGAPIVEESLLRGDGVISSVNLTETIDSVGEFKQSDPTVSTATFSTIPDATRPANSPLETH